MSSAVAFVGGAIAGSVIEILVALLFEDFFRGWYNRLRRRWLQIRSLLRGEDFSLSRGLFQVGRAKANCVVLDGAAERPYQPGHLVCQLIPEPLEIPADLQALRAVVEEQQKAIGLRKGHATFFNGPMVALKDWSHSRTAASEEALLFLRFTLTDYYTFLATSLSLDTQVADEGGPITVRDKHLRVNPHLDRSSQSQIDLFETARRGAMEELGLEVSTTEIRFFSLLVDTAWYMYGLSGAVIADRYTRDDIMSRHSMGTKDKWETAELYYTRFDPQSVWRLVNDLGGVRHFHPSSFVSLTQTLVHEYGAKTALKAFDRASPSR